MKKKIISNFTDYAVFCKERNDAKSIRTAYEKLVNALSEIMYYEGISPKLHSEIKKELYAIACANIVKANMNAIQEENERK